MSTGSELEQMFDVTPEQIAQIDADASAGILQGKPGTTVSGPGRPSLCDEALQQISFKESKSTIKAIDKRASQLGMRRSDYLRQLVENDLSCVGML